MRPNKPISDNSPFSGGCAPKPANNLSSTGYHPILSEHDEQRDAADTQLLSAPLVMPYAFALIRVQVTPAAAERQERQRPSERGGVISP
ncbi:hypothetical protein ZB44_23295 [Salmonella enterica subsp. enterica serovar Enteritidis]|nr:hypothetical protein [Salmonella enterica subsp. enterica serovar Enteritidis]